MYPKFEGPEGLTQHGQQHPLPERASWTPWLLSVLPKHTSLNVILVILGTDIEQI